jgi:predicted GTPase
MNVQIEEVLNVVKKAVQLLPNPPRDSINKEIHIIQELIMHSRPPRIMIIGRRGAGKSSLINAIFQEEVAAVGSVSSENTIRKMVFLQIRKWFFGYNGYKRFGRQIQA